MKQRSLQLLVSFGLILLLSVGCSAAAPTQIPVGLSATPNPPIDLPATVPSASPTETFTPLPTIPPVLPVAAGSPVPQPSEVISPENVDRIVEIANWTGHYCDFSQTFSPDSQTLVSTSCDQDSKVRLWHLANGSEQAFDYAGAGFGATFSPDGKLLAVWSNGPTISLFDVASGIELRTLEHTAHLFHADISPDGTLIAGAGADGTIRLWDLASGDELPSLSANLGEKYANPLDVRNVAFSPDGTTLASADDDGKVRLWDLASSTVLKAIAIANAREVREVIFSQDGSLLAVYIVKSNLIADTYESFVTLFDAKNGSKLRSFGGGSENVLGFDLSPDARMLAIMLEGGTIVLYDMASGSELRRFGAGGADYVGVVVFSPDGKFIASENKYPDENIIQLWGIYP